MDLDDSAPHAGRQPVGTKRKRSHDDLVYPPSPMDDVVLVNPNGMSQDHTPLQDHTSKRPRQDQALDASHSNSRPTTPAVTDLPAEILQHIFSFVHPITLGQLLSVCKLFNTLLNPVTPMPASSPGIRSITIRKQNDIWARSRNIHLHGYPRPMEDMTELEMWRFLRVRRCQFCHRKARRSPTFLNTTPWNGGPGPDDVRTIWPFRIRSCGSCLEPRLLMDKDLLLSASSFLADGLPFAFFTPSFHYVTTVNLGQHEPPPSLQLRKFFYRGHVDELEDKVIAVRALGNGAVEEWSKGLGSIGAMRREDAARFEKWELSVTAHLHLQTGTSNFPTPTRSLKSLPPSKPHAMSYETDTGQVRDVTMMSPLRPQSAQSSLHSSYTIATTLPPGPEMPLQTFAPAPGQSLSNTNKAPFPRAESVASGRTARSQSKAKPNPQDVERLRSEKRADIERRCQTIDPPLRASILPFMDAYNAAIQILMPLNEAAWDKLKHRLLLQRDEAEQKEVEYLNAQEALELHGEDKELFEEQRRLDRATNDRIWDELGTPARQKLKSYADDHIAAIWDGGMTVTAATSANFAADVLVHVVRRFDEGVVEEDKLLASRNMRLPSGSSIPDIRRLQLEDIKWVFDESVRPHTERFGKEIFLCSVCEGTTKRFTFDGVIQHFAAKHTNGLSKGTQVVHWKAEWPREPPFHTFPESVWNRPPPSRVTSYVIPGQGPFNAPESVTHSRSPVHSIARSSTCADQPPRLPTLYERHCDEVTEAGSDALEVTENIRGLPDSVRLYVIIHLVVRSFCSKFPNEPTLTMFADCVNHKSSLRQIRDLHGLRCKACWMDNQVFQQRMPKDYWLSDLLAHFQATHTWQGHLQEAIPEFRSTRQPLDWKTDMIELPPEQIVRNLAQAPGMNALKLEAIRSVFPTVFARHIYEIQRTQDSSLRRYYIPVDQDLDEYGQLPIRRHAQVPGQHVGSTHEFRHEGAREIRATGHDAGSTGSGYPYSSPRYQPEPIQGDILYRPRREIVYFDDHPGAVSRHTYLDNLESQRHVALPPHPTTSLTRGGSTHSRHEAVPTYPPDFEASRDLPFRLLRGEADHATENDGQERSRSLPPSATIADTILSTDRIMEQRDSALAAADHFLSTFDPSVGPAATATSMSRTASGQHRSLVDTDNVGVSSPHFSQSGTPARLHQDASSRASQIATRADTPAESHASQYGLRAASRNSNITKSSPSDAYRPNDLRPNVRPRTPPASRPPYAASELQGHTRPVDWYETSPSTIYRGQYDSRLDHNYVASGYDYARHRSPPVDEQHYRRQEPVRYVEVLGYNDRPQFEEPLSPEMARYEFSRHVPREAAYTEGRFELVQPRFAPRTYAEDVARSRPAERHAL